MDSYVVRVWRSSDGGSPATATSARGVAVHVRTGTTRTFHSNEELLRFLLDEPAAAAANSE